MCQAASVSRCLLSAQDASRCCQRLGLESGLVVPALGGWGALIVRWEGGVCRWEVVMLGSLAWSGRRALMGSHPYAHPLVTPGNTAALLRAPWTRHLAVGHRS